MENNESKKQPLNDVAEAAKDKDLSLFACKQKVLEAMNDTAEAADAIKDVTKRKDLKQPIQERIDE